MDMDVREFLAIDPSAEIRNFLLHQVVERRRAAARERFFVGQKGNFDFRTLKKQQVGEIPVPPKYDTKDFVSTTFWRLRGKLDVPKERFITYPHCNRDADRTPVIGWAGWDHL